MPTIDLDPSTDCHGGGDSVVCVAVKCSSNWKVKIIWLVTLNKYTNVHDISMQLISINNLCVVFLK